MATKTNLKPRKRLSALYQRGVEVRFGPNGPETGDPDVAKGRIVDSDGNPKPVGNEDIQMWVRPPSPLQREMAMRDAQASRARALVNAKRKEDSEEHLTIMAFLADMSDETLVEYVLLSTTQERQAEASRDILGNDEWKDSAELSDALRQFDEMSDTELAAHQEEYDALMERDAEFGRQVAAREAELMDIERDSLSFRSREDLERKALEKRSELVGQQAFMYEYEQQMQFYATRDFDEPGELFFSSAREMAESDEEVLTTIKDAIALFINEVGEAKNWQGAASGSEQSESPSEPETSAPSIPLESTG